MSSNTTEFRTWHDATDADDLDDGKENPPQGKTDWDQWDKLASDSAREFDTPKIDWKDPGNNIRRLVASLNGTENRQDIQVKAMGNIHDSFVHSAWSNNEERVQAADETSHMIFKELKALAPESQELLEEIRLAYARTITGDPTNKGAHFRAREMGDAALNAVDGNTEHAREILQAPTSYNALIEMAGTVEAELGYKPSSEEAAQYLAEKAAIVLQETAERMARLGNANAEHAQAITKAAQAMFTEQLRDTTMAMDPEWPRNKFSELEGQAERLSNILDDNRGSVVDYGGIFDPLPRDTGWSKETSEELAWKLTENAYKTEDGRELMETVGHKLREWVAKANWQNGYEITVDAGEADKHAEAATKALEYLLRPQDDTYWKLHDAPQEEQLKYSEQRAEETVADAHAVADLMAQQGHSMAENTQHIVGQCQSALEWLTQSAIERGDPHELSVDQTRAQLYRKTISDLAFLNAGDPTMQTLDPDNTPRLPLRMQSGEDHTGHHSFHAAQGYIEEVKNALQESSQYQYEDREQKQVAWLLLDYTKSEMDQADFHPDERVRAEAQERVAETLQALAMIIEAGTQNGR